MLPLFNDTGEARPMGLFDWFRRSRSASPGPAVPGPPHGWQPAPLPRPAAYGEPGFAVIDVETTGLSASSHRVLELAIVRTDPSGRVLDEWVSRFNPDGPVGATHIHGIRDRDVARAPRFGQLLPEITARLAGAAIAGHNVRFDLAFLRAEYARAGWALPHLPAACTLDHSWDHLPQLDRRRLADCCAATGIRLDGAHSALGDARAAAVLLASYLDPQFGCAPGANLLVLPGLGQQVTWPTTPGSARPPVADLPDRVQRKIVAEVSRPPAEPLVRLLKQFRLADAVDEGAPDGALAYLELLAEVLEDGVLTEDERAGLHDLADIYDLDAAAVAAAHRGFLLTLAHEAVDDGKISRAERAELTHIAQLLDVPTKAVTAVLDAAEHARHERLSAGLRSLPPDWSLGEPLRVGDKVVFTGCDDGLRDRLERRCEQLGVRVLGTVSSRTAMLVTDGRFSGGKAVDAAEHGVRCVHPDAFVTLLNHLQPAPAKSAPAVPRPRQHTSSPVNVAPAGVSPAAVRAWARANGYDVGERGRLPAEVFDAYGRAEIATPHH
jgi:DNA polymerase-3 subunit epsilon